ncbi:MAG: hypothetical protein JSS49_13710 [Planctomycetes bacterium]|nr:hypothetical protein [Planctomycetota bacterium]
MLAFKLALLFGDSLILALLAIGLYVAFGWLRFPDLTPDGSFVLGAVAFVTIMGLHGNWLFAMGMAALAGALAGTVTAFVNQWFRVAPVIASLVTSTGLYSICWFILRKPNQFVETKWTLTGPLSGTVPSLILCSAVGLTVAAGVAVLAIFGSSLLGLRLRAVGEKPNLARDLRTTLFSCTVIGLAIANSFAGIAGAFFAQRSFSADVNMGIGITISGLSAVVLGCLFAGKREAPVQQLICIVLAAILCRTVLFVSLEMGVPAEAFRLVAAGLLFSVFAAANLLSFSPIRNIRWK